MGPRPLILKVVIYHRLPFTYFLHECTQDTLEGHVLLSCLTLSCLNKVDRATCLISSLLKAQPDKAPILHVPSLTFLALTYRHMGLSFLTPPGTHALGLSTGCSFSLRCSSSRCLRGRLPTPSVSAMMPPL